MQLWGGNLRDWGLFAPILEPASGIDLETHLENKTQAGSKAAASAARSWQETRTTPQPEANPERIGVFLVSSNRLLREALSRFLRKKEDLEVFGETFFSAEVFAEIAAKPVQVLLLDDSPAEFAGRPVLADLLERNANLKVILLGMADDEKTFLRSVRAGCL